MNSPWLRAIRSAALHPRHASIAARHARPFHASTSARASDGTNDAPRDDGKKPDESDGDGGRKPDEADKADENMFGDKDTAGNGDSHGRKARPANGFLRSRTLRSRKSELPPFQVPKSFLSGAVDRHGETRNTPGLITYDIDQRMMNEVVGRGVLDSIIKNEVGAARNASVFEASLLSEQAVEEVFRSLEANEDMNPFLRQGDLIIASAFWSVVHESKHTSGGDVAAAKARLGSASILSSTDLLTTLMQTGLLYPEESKPALDKMRKIVHDTVNGVTAVPCVALYSPPLIQEVIASVKTDLLFQAPKNVKLSDLRRPVTVINEQHYSGCSVPHEIVRHVATLLEADVLHLQPHDLAHIIGSYIGQDAARAPGPVAQLGYKAAENSGRLKPKPQPLAEDEGQDSGVFMTLFASASRSPKLKRDSAKSIASMDDFLNAANRGKNDDLWEDMKVNAAVEELIHSTDTDTEEQRPLIVHMHDFNAIGMDLECGAAIIGKIRKVVDDLWLGGRKIALVGSCSSKGAPQSYAAALRELELKERVVHIILNTPKEFPPNFLEGEARDYLNENDGNIVKSLSSMVEPPEDSKFPYGLLGLAGSDAELPAAWSTSILSLPDVYRIASMMIGSTSGDQADMFSLARLEKVAAHIREIDSFRDRSNKEAPKKEAKEDVLAGMRNPYAEDHEKKLLSGLVKPEDIRTTFKDVHAPKETIESVKMLTTLSLVRPEAFSYGVLATDRIPGCLLYGPPGTGKTLLAKAVAKESGANMIEISGASINNMYVGESEKNVRALFRLAKKKEPMVIFIDEADALLGARGGRGNAARRETINQFLREWDGMDKMKAFIMVATNRPFDLDEAVLRRLPRKLLIDLPLEADRAAILRIHLKDEVLDDSVSIDDLAKRTPLYSGSDLKNVCVAAAMAAVKEELEAADRHAGPEPYVWAEKRVLHKRHFVDRALREIGASVSEDMSTLTAIKKFDERYGDAGAGRRKRKGMGFGVVADGGDADAARVRSGSGSGGAR